MDTQTEARETVALLLTDKATPKAALAKLQEQTQGLPGMDTAIHDLKQLPWNAKAKAEPVLRDLLEKLDEEEEEQVGGTARMQEIETSISDLMQEASTSLLKIGSLLNEARGEFSAAPEFLGWAHEKFGFKKAYCYRLMRVAEDFSPQDVLAGQSINVLHKLAAMPEEVKQQARERVEQGEKITGDAVKAMGGAETPDKAPSESEQEEVGQSTAVDDKDRQSATLGDDAGAPWSSSQHDTGVTEPTKVEEAAPDSEVARLRELVSELQAELAASRLERESKAASKPKAPSLPQFQSPCMYARLGLSAEQGNDAGEVRKAFRALVKAGYNSQHEAYGLLLEAKDALMQQEEAA